MFPSLKSKLIQVIDLSDEQVAEDFRKEFLRYYDGKCSTNKAIDNQTSSEGSNLAKAVQDPQPSTTPGGSQPVERPARRQTRDND